MPVEEFKEFYSSCLNLKNEDLTQFLESTNSHLPSVFRVTPTPYTDQIIQRISKYSFVRKIDYVKGNIYEFDLKLEHPLYKEFIDFLVTQSNVGNIQRQELVSYIPHLFLDVKPDHKVLETCASPGSKTKNLLEIIKDGILISNDKSSSRVNILISESMKKASSNFLITQLDAMHFPTLNIKFDRICCDVPCSSDGTFKKNPAILPKWKIADAVALSRVQQRILKRALELLRLDGILVYSTCSLNPMENEWIVNSILEECPGQFKLENDFDFIQFEQLNADKLTVRKGITAFKYKDYEYNNEELSKCIRIMPHDQNTGGFFITVIRKVSEATPNVATEVNRLNRAFVDVDPKTLEKIAKSTGNFNTGDHFVSFNKNFKNIFAVSDLCYNVLCNNPKLKVAYAGIKAFTESDLNKDQFRLKNAFIESKSIPSSVKFGLDDFKALLTSKYVENSKLKIVPNGLFIAEVEGSTCRFSGFSDSNKTFLYIDENHKKALAQLYFE